MELGGSVQSTRDRDLIKRDLKMAGGEMAKKTEKMSVLVEEELRDRLSRAAFSADVTGSELVRACILTALPLLEETPSLINIIPTLPVNSNRIVVG